MTKRTTVLSLTLLPLLLMMGFTSDPNSTRYSFTATSEMRVEGTSTVHGWVAEVGTINGNLEITGGGILDGGVIAGGSLAIPVTALDADNDTMNKKIRQALKADSHDKILFELTSAGPAEKLRGNSFRILATGNLKMAGAQKLVEIMLEGEDIDGESLRLTGSYTLKMSDFSIKPPTALLGTLKTGDEVTIHFDLLAAKDAA